MCLIFAMSFGRYTHGENHIYYYVQDPEDVNGTTNIFWYFEFNTFPIGVNRTDSNGLEDTQDAGDTDGHAPAQSENI